MSHISEVKPALDRYDISFRDTSPPLFLFISLVCVCVDVWLQKCVCLCMCAPLSGFLSFIFSTKCRLTLWMYVCVCVFLCTMYRWITFVCLCNVVSMSACVCAEHSCSEKVSSWRHCAGQPDQIAGYQVHTHSKPKGQSDLMAARCF